MRKESIRLLLAVVLALLIAILVGMGVLWQLDKKRATEKLASQICASTSNTVCPCYGQWREWEHPQRYTWRDRQEKLHLKRAEYEGEGCYRK